MRTIAYVDGQNLYFSCLKGTKYKWLDIAELLARIICEDHPSNELVAVRYFNSPIKGSLARRGKDSAQAQAEYLRALRNNPLIRVSEGRFSVQRAHVLRHAIPPDLTDRVGIWRIEEKETDVSIAVAMYRDVRDGLADHIVLLSNDSDFVPALKAIREDSLARVGVVLPLRALSSGMAAPSRPSASLTAHAHWTRHHIREDELAKCQLPQRVHTSRRPACRPSHW